jgi:hypothetical protein
MAKTRGTGPLMRWTVRVRDPNPWTRRLRHHMRLDAGPPVVYRRINPPVPPS